MCHLKQELMGWGAGVAEPLTSILKQELTG
jgi:hypothetical protein